MTPLKIGILLNPARELWDYEARIFSTLINDQRYEVVCTIKDGRKPTNKGTTFQELKKAKLKDALLKPLLLWILDFFESRLLKKKGPEPSDNTDVIAKISALPCIEMMPEKKNLLDVFSKEDCAKIENYNLDVLLRHEFGSIKGEILNIPKYGIWSLQHDDDNVNIGGPGGFWEAYNNSSVTGVTLQVLEDKFEGARVIQKGFYNTDPFWYLNREISLDNSVDLILKHLGLLYENRELKYITSSVYSNRPNRFPSFFQTFNYIFKKYSTIVFRKFLKMICRTVVTEDSIDVWKLHVGKGSIENAVLWRSKTIEPPDNEFWADPFLFEHEKQLYVFFEVWEYSREKGKISVGIIKNDQITEIRDCLDVDYHLSYPFVFEHNNEIFMIPETAQMKRLEIWRCDNFPNNWSLEKTCFEGEGRSLVDSTIAKDSNNQFWLFANFSSGKFLNHGSNLSVFKIDSPMMNEIIPHKLNPVVTDCRSARNAGNIYIDDKGRLIRPSQASQNGIYGECLNLCHVKELTIDTYEEEILETITPEFKNGLFSVHHVSQAGGIFIVDGCYTNR